jgi:hypothetical protein
MSHAIEVNDPPQDLRHRQQSNTLFVRTTVVAATHRKSMPEGKEKPSMKDGPSATASG